MILRKMTSADIPTGLKLCRHAGWNQVFRDWDLFLRLSPEGCRVAQLENVVGTVTTVRYQNHFSWVGMILVDPEHQRQGIGTKLLLESLTILQDEDTVKLDASFEGRQLYLKMNFVDEYVLSRMTLQPAWIKRKSSMARPLQSNDLAEMMKLDAGVFGADRQPLLEWLLTGAPQLAFLVEEDNEIKGYCFGRIGEQFMHIGPVVAKRPYLAKELVLAALNNNHGQAAIIDIPHFDPSWMEWLESIGFEEQRPFYRMYLGPNRFPGMPENQYAILGPEFG